jgi:hypothetical protein
MIKAKKVAVLVQLESNDIHQVLITKEQQEAILSLIIATTESKNIEVMSDPIDTIEFKK